MKFLITLAICMMFVNSTELIAKNRFWTINRQQFRQIATNCETASSTLASTHQAARATGADSLIIAIARLGDGEYRKVLNRRRLHNVRVFLVDFWKRAAETIVTAEGARVRGYGRVELYVGGKLFDVILIETNGDLPVSLTCEPDNMRPKWADRNLYPYRDKRPKRFIGSTFLLPREQP